MTEDICGEIKGDGEPCDFPPKHSDGKCGHHTETGENKDQGRPSKLSKEVVDQITTHIAEGKSDNSAFRLCDLHPSTKGNWLGRVDPDEVPEDPEFEEDPYGYFFRRYTRARGLGEDFYFSNVIEMALEAEDYAFVASLMKQRYGDSWGNTETGVDVDKTVIQLPDSVTQKWQRQTKK